MRITTAALAAALTIALAVPTALLAEGVGSITADMNGEAKEWHIISVTRGDKTIVSAGFKNSDRLSDLTVQGHPEPRFTTADVLSINASWFGKYEPGKAPVAVELIFMPAGMSKPFYTSDQVPGEPVVTVETLELGEETGRIVGTFSGKLCLVPKLYEAPDMNDCKDIAGGFDTLVQVR